MLLAALIRVRRWRVGRRPGLGEWLALICGGCTSEAGLGGVAGLISVFFWGQRRVIAGLPIHDFPATCARLEGLGERAWAREMPVRRGVGLRGPGLAERMFLAERGAATAGFDLLALAAATGSGMARPGGGGAALERPLFGLGELGFVGW